MRRQQLKLEKLLQIWFQFKQFVSDKNCLTFLTEDPIFHSLLIYTKVISFLYHSFQGNFSSCSAAEIVDEVGHEGVEHLGVVQVTGVAAIRDYLKKVFLSSYN